MIKQYYQNSLNEKLVSDIADFAVKAMGGTDNIKKAISTSALQMVTGMDRADANTFYDRVSGQNMSSDVKRILDSWKKANFTVPLGIEEKELVSGLERSIRGMSSQQRMELSRDPDTFSNLLYLLLVTFRDNDKYRNMKSLISFNDYLGFENEINTLFRNDLPRLRFQKTPGHYVHGNSTSYSRILIELFASKRFIEVSKDVGGNLVVSFQRTLSILSPFLSV